MAVTQRSASERLLPRSHDLLKGTSIAAWIVIGGAVPLIFGRSSYLLGEFEYILAILMVATGLNITLGFAGQLFLGPSGLFSVGAFTAAVVAFHSTAFQSLPMMCLAAVGTSLVVAVGAALPSLRMSGFYLGMVTLFIALVIPDIASNWSLTGGSNGLSLETLLTFTQHPAGYALYLTGVAIVALLCGYAWLVKSSRLGRQFGALMASEELAVSVGIRPYRTKLIAFLIGAVPCGIGGAYYVYSEQFINSSAVQPTLSIYILAGLTVGGSGTILGPIIGTALVGAATQFLGSFNQYEGIIYGLALIAMASVAPRGILGLYDDLKARWQASSLTADRRGAESSVVALAAANAWRERLATEPPPPLALKGVRRNFGGVRAVAGVDLTVRPGRVHAVVGPNGSGKTTLLNLICGFYHVDGGEIWLGDERLDRLNPAAIARLGVARTFQTPKLMLAESAQANVVPGVEHQDHSSLWAAVLHTPASVRKSRVARGHALDLLHGIGLSTTVDRPAGLLPHGTQRLLEIGRAVAIQPKYVLLDEPAAGLAGTELKGLENAIREIAASGVGVVLVEHNLPVVFGLADVVTVLHQGEVIAEGSPAEVSADPRVVEIYIGRRHAAREAEASLQTQTLEERT